jgi:hypothetical protein
MPPGRLVYCVVPGFNNKSVSAPASADFYLKEVGFVSG